MENKLNLYCRELINKFNIVTTGIEVSHVRLFHLNGISDFELFDADSGKWITREMVQQDYLVSKGMYADFQIEFIKVLIRIRDAYNRDSGTSGNDLRCEFSKETFELLDDSVEDIR